MNGQRYDEVADLFKALAHPARLRILISLRYGEECVCHLETLLDKPQAYVSQQLAMLRAAGLVRDRKDGQRVYYAIADYRLLPLLDRFLDDVDVSLDSGVAAWVI
jgi:DNA-binding transcriptional ArsR family regulator